MRWAVLMVLWAAVLAGQDTLRFEPWFNGGPLVIEENNTDPSASSGGAANAGAGVRIEAVKIYLSGFALLRRGGVVYRQAGSYHLLDAARPGSWPFRSLRRRG